MQISFHDPDGVLFRKRDRLHRRTSAAAGARLLRFLASDLAAELMAQGILVPTQQTAPPAWFDAPTPGDVDAVWFEHPCIEVASYAHEWVPEMLLAAAQLTLDLALRLRRQGWDLKDGTTSNVLFVGTRPMFVDWCSIVERRDDTPSWWPAGQFERHFILPLMAYRQFGLTPDKLHRIYSDGLPPEELYRFAGVSRWFSPQWLRYCILPTLAARSRGAGSAAAPAASAHAASDARRAEVNLAAQDWQLQSLGRTLGRLSRQLPAAASDWQRYTDTRSHYASEAVAAKRQTVERWMAAQRPGVVLDLGANTGEFSVLCARLGAKVLALERDVESARAAHAALLREAPTGQVMVQDLAQPSPAMGWRYVERRSLARRLEGHADCVLCLAFMHHMLVSGGIPLDELLAQLARYTRRWAVIEFVGPQDPVFQTISRQRGLRFDGLDLTRFLQSVELHFKVLEQVAVPGTTRVLVLCERLH